MVDTDSRIDGNHGTRRRFRPGWPMTVFALLFLPVLLSLGSWQLERAEEKRRFEDAYMDSVGAMPRPPGAAVTPFERLRLEGEYETDHYFLVDNQTRDGAVGYGVVSSFLGTDGRRWLINRGFLPGDRTRRTLPEVTTPSGPVTLTGLVWPDLGLMPVFGDNSWPEGWPKRVQRLEVARMAALLPETMAVEIRLEPGQPGVFTPAVVALNMPASTHTGYAVQWFGLAAALSIGYVIFGFRRQ